MFTILLPIVWRSESKLNWEKTYSTTKQFCIFQIHFSATLRKVSLDFVASALPQLVYRCSLFFVHTYLQARSSSGAFKWSVYFEDRLWSFVYHLPFQINLQACMISLPTLIDAIFWVESPPSPNCFPSLKPTFLNPIRNPRGDRSRGGGLIN